MDDFATGYMAGQDSGSGNGGGWGGFGEGLWAVIILAILFGRGGFGGFGGFGGGGCEGGCATQADLAAGFNNSAVLSGLNDIKLGQANAINYNNQGFTGLNTALMQGFHGVDNAVCTLGFNMQTGFNTLGFNMKDCCCETQRLIERGFCDMGNAINTQTRDIIDNANANYRGLMDFMVQSKLDALRDENASLKLSASQAKQNQYLVDQLRPCPVPAYITCNPFAASYGYGTGYNNGGCGCGCG